MPENWGIFWILLSGICISGFAVSIITCIGAAREGAKALLSPPPASATTTTTATTIPSRQDEQQQQQQQSVESEGSHSSTLGRCVDTAAEKATEDERDALLAGEYPGCSAPHASTDSTSTGPSPRAEGNGDGHSSVVVGEEVMPATWQQQHQSAGNEHQRAGGGGGLDVPAGAAVAARAGGEVKMRSGENRTAVQNIFKNFNNLSDLLGLKEVKVSLLLLLFGQALSIAVELLQEERWVTQTASILIPRLILTGVVVSNQLATWWRLLRVVMAATAAATEDQTAQRHTTIRDVARFTRHRPALAAGVALYDDALRV